MARHASTYRQARRAAWRANNALSLNRESWASYNAKERTWNKADAKHFAAVRADYIGTAAGRSKHMPHIAAKQRAKGASA